MRSVAVLSQVVEIVVCILLPGLMLGATQAWVATKMGVVTGRRPRSHVVSVFTGIIVAAYIYFDYTDFVKRSFDYLFQRLSGGNVVDVHHDPLPGPDSVGASDTRNSMQAPARPNGPVVLTASDADVRSMLGTWCNDISKDRIWLEGGRIFIQNTITPSSRQRLLYPDFKDGSPYEIHFARNGQDFYYDGGGNSRQHVEFNPENRNFLTVWAYERTGNTMERFSVDERRCA